jgi:hypothetical protein
LPWLCICCFTRKEGTYIPYINKEDRLALERNDKQEVSSGELNYSITILVLRYLKNHGERYQTYNDIMGALEGAKLEIYRRRIGVYEDSCIKKNGDL